jgi:hypothetical protein
LAAGITHSGQKSLLRRGLGDPWSSGKRLSGKTTAGKPGIRPELSAITIGRKVPFILGCCGYRPEREKHRIVTGPFIVLRIIFSCFPET